MNGKRLPVILGLALLPAVALGPAQTAQAATDDPAITSVTGARLDPMSAESWRSDRGARENIQQAPMQRESMRPEEPGEEQSEQSELYGEQQAEQAEQARQAREAQQSEQAQQEQSGQEQSEQSGESWQEQYGRPMSNIVEEQRWSGHTSQHSRGYNMGS
ncbi:hypothetical protein Pth03_23770 [Planotetraspora thailandica]|uniref:Uncharacterized protein n=1 Tax=Planotetraspora thailandica TaxID=487172 RepID=A0A8J3XY83_9ACTN|nr:hypothetical protein [Planotetraspora thailandica]GII53988.1 hypothetical protein Pth03_23770 [Planotetraspora thailandica]